MITDVRVIGGAVHGRGLMLRSDAGRLVLDGDETRDLCRLLQALLPENFPEPPRCAAATPHTLAPTAPRSRVAGDTIDSPSES